MAVNPVIAAHNHHQTRQHQSLQARGSRMTRTLKILLVGDSTVGKTAFMHRYVNNVFLADYKSTVGVDFAQKFVEWRTETEDLGLNLQIWDLAGQDRFASMTRVYYRDAHGALVLFDLTNARTFDGAAKWKADIDAKCRLLDGSPIPCLLLGNKSDLRLQRDITQDKIEQFANKSGFIGWAETSVKQNTFVEDAVMFLLEHILQRLSIAETTSELDPGGGKSFQTEKLSPVGGPVIKLGSEKNTAMTLAGEDKKDSKKSGDCC